MKGLNKIPDERELEGAYARLQGGEKFSVENYALYSQWARFDPRLAEQLVSAIARDWRSVSPVALNEQIKKQPWPAAFGVLIEHAVLFITQSNAAADPAERELFMRWKDCAMSGIARASDENFFIGIRAFGGRASFADAVAATKPYRSWGYFAKEPILRGIPENSTLIPRAARLTAIEALLSDGRRFTASDYMALLDGAIHRRQAQRDLESHPHVVRAGKTRAAVYFAKRQTGRR